MLVAIDYDGTYTADPAAWDVAIRVLRLAGHEVVCVTMRYENEAITTNLPGGCLIYYTGRKAKIQWCKAHGIHPDIWIDDEPHWLLKDSL